MKLLCLAALCAGSLSTAAFADTLSPAQFATIKAAYAEAMPSMNDRLPDYRMKIVLAAYGTHDPAPETDALSPQRVAMMQRAYRTHDVSEGFQLAAN